MDSSWQSVTVDRAGLTRAAWVAVAAAILEVPGAIVSYLEVITPLNEVNANVISTITGIGSGIGIIDLLLNIYLLIVLRKFLSNVIGYKALEKQLMALIGLGVAALISMSFLLSLPDLQEDSPALIAIPHICVLLVLLVIACVGVVISIIIGIKLLVECKHDMFGYRSAFAYLTIADAIVGPFVVFVDTSPLLSLFLLLFGASFYFVCGLMFLKAAASMEDRSEPTVLELEPEKHADP